MASSKEYLNFILEQLSEADDISFRPMMGEYIIYCHGKIIGGIHDDRFFIKPTVSSKNPLPYGRYENHMMAQKICFWWKNWMIRHF